MGCAYFCLKHKVKLKWVKEDREFPSHPGPINWGGRSVYVYRCPIDNKEYHFKETPSGRISDSEEAGLLPTIELSLDIRNNIKAASTVLELIKQGKTVPPNMSKSTLEDLEKLLKIVDEEKAHIT